MKTTRSSVLYHSIQKGELPPMSDHLLKPIEELRYVTAPNVDRYRLVMRFFYEQHQRLRYWLKPEDVHYGVLQYQLLGDYTLDQCQKDLSQLVEWKNLIPRHDGGRSTSIEEYLRKKFRYQMTPYSVEIERMVAGLELIRGYGGSLEPTLLDTIADSLRRIMHHGGQFPPGEALALWRSTYEAFVKLTENASDYIASLQSSKAEELMQTEAFLTYKQNLTQYLQSFVQGLQRIAPRIEGLLVQFPSQTLEQFFLCVNKDLANLPQIEEVISPEEEQERLTREWSSLVRWFLGEQGENSDVEFLEQATKETIAKIVRCALRIQEKRRSGISRKRELEYLGQWFFSLESIEEAHKLGAYAFGLYRTRHFQGFDEKGTESSDISMWSAAPNLRGLKSRSRTRRRDSGTQSIANHNAQKEQARQAYLAQREAEKTLLDSFVSRKEVAISDLEGVTPFLRTHLLLWIGRCMSNPAKQFRTPEGVRISLVAPPANQRATLRCDDGELIMPDYTLRFEGIAI